MDEIHTAASKQWHMNNTVAVETIRPSHDSWHRLYIVLSGAVEVDDGSGRRNSSDSDSEQESDEEGEEDERDANRLGDHSAQAHGNSRASGGEDVFDMENMITKICEDRRVVSELMNALPSHLRRKIAVASSEQNCNEVCNHRCPQPFSPLDHRLLIALIWMEMEC